MCAIALSITKETFGWVPVSKHNSINQNVQFKKTALDSEGIPYYAEETAKHILKSEKMPQNRIIPKAQM